MIENYKVLPWPTKSMDNVLKAYFKAITVALRVLLVLFENYR